MASPEELKIEKPTAHELRGLPRTEKLRDCLQVPHDGTTTDKALTCPDITKAPFFKARDEDSVLLFGEAFEPELGRLKDAAPTVEAVNAQTKGNLVRRDDDGKITEENLTPSRLLYGYDFAEVNRSIVGVLALKWLVNRNYDAFVSDQLPVIRLTRTSFEEMRKRFIDDLQTAEEVYALIVSTIANDLGKDSSMLTAYDDLFEAGSPTPNHDEIIFAAASKGHLDLIEEFPESNPTRKSLILGLKFGARLNVAQFAQAENVPGSLAAVECMKGEDRAFALKFLEIILDVAGAQGHNDARCAKAMNNPLWRSFASTRHILLNIVHQGITLRVAYDQMLEQRAFMLQDDGYRKLDVQKPKERAMLRIMTMGRVTQASSAILFEAAINSLSITQSQELVGGLSVDGIEDGTAIIPYYAPSLFSNTLNQTDTMEDEARSKALAAVLRFLVKVYAGTKPDADKGKGLIVECDVSFVQDIFKVPPGAKVCEFANNPQLLDKLDVPAERYSVPKEEWI